MTGSNSTITPQADLAGCPLPSFIKRRDGALWVDLTALDSSLLFLGFIDRCFSSGFRFEGGDYALVQRMIYQLQAAEIDVWAESLRAKGKASEVRLAKDVVGFSDERKLFYRGWKKSLKGDQAEYFFEPIYLERKIEETVPGELQDDGSTSEARVEIRTINELQSLDVDEFFAAAWLNGVRHGWDVAKVEAEFAKCGGAFKGASKLTLARMTDPVAGKDASLIEQTDSLHRSDAPKALRNGRVDLTQFHNRFPQVKKGTLLLKKVPMVDGVVGHNVEGEPLAPERPSDFSLDELAGPGTRIERNAKGEFILALNDGFLNIDTKTNLISVTEKIVNREGVSVRTTGNLSLQGDEFEEHGEVQERRVVEGMNMTFMADVFGNVVSRGGVISLRSHLAGGSARSPAGRIEVLGGASRAVIEAPGGEVFVKFAESTRIVARKVHVERACMCSIVAEEVIIDLSEGCAVAGRNVHIASSGQRKTTETTVVVPLPDIKGYEKTIKGCEVKIAELGEKSNLLLAAYQAQAAAPEVKTFLMVQKKRTAGEITMTPEQEAQYRALGAKAAPGVKKMTDLRTAIQGLKTQQAEFQQQIAAAVEERDKKLAGLACQIDMVTGETVVRARAPLSDEGALETLSTRDLEIRLRERGANSQQLFSGSSGKFEWHWGAT